MTPPRFDEGDEVVVVGDHSDFRGQWGRVKEYQQWCDRYFVELPDVSDDLKFAYQGDELELLTDSDEEEAGDDEDDPDTAYVTEFGMSAESFESFLEFLLTRTLAKVGTVGPADAFASFQEFEGQTPSEVLFGLLEKIEESIAMSAQLHILVGRIGFALSQIQGESE